MRGCVFLITHPASAGDGAHTHSHHLLGFSAALAPKFTHSLAGLGFADGVVFLIAATAGSARDPHGSPRPRNSPRGIYGQGPRFRAGLGFQDAPGPRVPPAYPGLPRTPPRAVYPPIGLAWERPKTKVLNKEADPQGQARATNPQTPGESGPGFKVLI